ncbi:hypothetical protein MMC32_007867 [Xylographa parallela]|nr:hypothetical protein [Xylographa parallela]
MESLPSPSTLNDPESDLDPELAAQMGFASFGAQLTVKKRKYNPAAEAVTSFLPPIHAGLPKNPPPPVGTGANSGPLRMVRVGENRRLTERGNWGAHGGKRYAEGERGIGRERVLGGGGRRGRGGRGGMEKSWGNEEGVSGSNSTPLGTRVGRGGEIGAVEELRMRVEAGTSPQSRDGENKEDDNGMPGYVDSTPPGSPVPRKSPRLTIVAKDLSMNGEAAPARHVEEEREEVVADAGSGPAGPPIASSGMPEDLPVRTQQSGSSGDHHDWNALRKGVRNEEGDVVYYDASFVEDPWKHLVGRIQGL